MTESAEVLLWGTRIGFVSRDEAASAVRFSYDAAFRETAIEPAPLMMPVGQRTFEFPELPYRSFHGLPGLLSDSVPDKFGNAVINVWLKSQGRMPDSLTPVERLCYTGTLDKDRTCDHIEAKIVFGLAQPDDPNARPTTRKDSQHFIAASIRCLRT